MAKPAGETFDFDVWDTTNVPDVYSLDKFYTGASDDKGHSKDVKIWVPNHVYAQLVETVHSRDIPAYRSAQDAFRDAFCHRIIYLRSKNYQIDTLMEAVQVEMNDSEIAWVMRRTESLDGSIATHKDALEAASKSQNQQLLMLAVGNTEQHAENMPSPWREEMLRMVGQYRALIKRG